MKKHLRCAVITSGQERTYTHTQCLPWVAAGPLIMVLTTAVSWLLSSGSSPSSLWGETKWKHKCKSIICLVNKCSKLKHNLHCLDCKIQNYYFHPANSEWWITQQQNVADCMYCIVWVLVSLSFTKISSPVKYLWGPTVLKATRKKDDRKKKY